MISSYRGYNAMVLALLLVAVAPDSNRFLNGGARFVGGSFPAGEPKMFDPDGSLISVAATPAADKFEYENNKGCPNRWSCFGD